MHKYNNIAVDSHVHFYKTWNIPLNKLLTTVYTNISNNLPDEIIANSLPAICLLDTNIDECLHNNKAGNDKKHETWKIQRNEKENCSYYAHTGNKYLLIVTGKQVNTIEGLEVLLLGDPALPEKKASTEHLLSIQNKNTLCIIPWAAGKWLGKRGQLVSGLIKSMDEKQFILGDNGGRPAVWKNISQFKKVFNKGDSILAGSDPLPIGKHYRKAGSYGNIVPVDLNYVKPWESLHASILNHNKLKTFGQLSSTTEFLLNQIKLRI